MLNDQNKGVTAAQDQFINNMALLLTAWGLQITAARTYAYLQLQNRPVSLDEIVSDLDISKGNASMATRLLEGYGIAHARKEKASRRILYEAGADLGAALRKNINLLSRKSDLIAHNVDQVATGDAARKLERLSAFYTRLKDAMESVVSDFDGSLRALPTSRSDDEEIASKAAPTRPPKKRAGR